MILFERLKEQPAKERFIQTVDGLGEVLEAAVRLRKTALVTSGLKRFKELFDALHEIRVKDGEKFERLILSDDMISLAKQDIERARFELGFNPEKHAVGLHTLIDQFLRIHRTAIEIKHDEISRLSIYQLNYILARAATQESNGLVVEQLINALSEAARAAVRANDRSMYAAAVHWYTDIVFNRLIREGSKFRLEYLGMFNSRFFQLAKLLIREQHQQLFEALTSALIDGIMIDVDWQGAFWKAVQVVELPKRADFDPAPYNRRLAGLISGGLTTEELPKALVTVDDLITTIRSHVTDSEGHAKLNAAAIGLKDSLEDCLKYHELLRLVTAIGAYCVFQSAESSLKTLWEYKQPPDADTEYIGHDIIPDRLDRIFSLFYSGQELYRDYDFHEDHHGSELYYERYLLLLLARLLDKGINTELPSTNDPIYLHRISDRIERLKGRVAEVASGERWGSLYRKDKAALFDDLEGKFEDIKLTAKSHLDEYVVKSDVSKEKISEFSANFLKEFSEENSVRKLFVQHGIFKDLTAIQDAERTRRNKREINQISEKEPFLPQWWAGYVDWGKQYGRRYALTEAEHTAKTLLRDLPLFTPTMQGAGPPALEALISALSHLTKSGYEPSVILTAYDMESMSDLKNTPDYVPHWHQDCPKSDIHGFHGCIRFNGRMIPVFWTSPQLAGKACVLDLKRLGTWTQLSPVEEPADNSCVHREFLIRIESFSHNEQRLQEVIAKNPPWLEAHGDKRQYLLHRALISIREAFEFELSDAKAGVQLLLRPEEQQETEGDAGTT